METLGERTINLLEDYKKALTYAEKEENKANMLDYAIDAVHLSEIAYSQHPLATTVVPMIYGDYKGRMKAELLQLKYRIESLKAYIDKQVELGKESIISASKLERLKAQLIYMDGYKAVLKERVAYLEEE